MMISLSAFSRLDETPNAPLPLFLNWFKAAEDKKTSYPNAMTLGTVDRNNRPQIRTVLLKSADEHGFVFYTNTQSQKGQELRHNPAAALCFYWKELSRQIRINGTASPVSDEEADAYFATRPRDSQIGAWASEQSRPMAGREALADRISGLKIQYPDDTPIPRPPHWSGYRVMPDYYEFWEEGAYRLHTRLIYKRADLTENKWRREFLYP